MAADLAQLRAAAAVHGIADGYDDVSGVHHDASAATLAALLRAVGADTTVGAIDATKANGLAPALVSRVGEAFSVAWPSAGHDWRWTLTLEDGAQLHGVTSASGIAFDNTLPPGYHALHVYPDGANDAGGALHTQLIVCPTACHVAPAIVAGGRIWGLALQLYAVRSARNWGIGDFTDLAAIVDIAADAGAGTIGLNPLHALFADAPDQASPYSPSDRAAINPLYLDVDAVIAFTGGADVREHIAAAGFQAQLASLRATDLVDYPAVARIKMATLARAYEHFREQHLAAGTTAAQAFRAFQRNAGRGLREYATFAALRASHHRDGAPVRWREWPATLATPTAAGVAPFVAANLAAVEFHEYLQWHAEMQLAAAADRATARGMTLGLYRDIAVGVNPDGAEAWRDGAMMARDVNIGAPPDEFNPAGQDWGLPPYAPVRLRDAGYAPFISMLRANMRHAGAIRIDHVMGLLRLFWVPAGMGPGAGTYVTYPLADLLGILALESVRHRCMVVGEDLGTVPPAIRTAMADYAILSYRPLYFERTSGGDFAPPVAYPRMALVAASTHDLATLPGFWQGADLAVRDELGLFPHPAQLVAQHRDRMIDRTRLLHALAATQLLPADLDAAQPPPTFTTDLAVATHQYLARTPCCVLVVQMEDVLGQLQQVNLPSTTEAVYPNWRRKLPTAIETWSTDGAVRRVTAALRAER